MATDLNIKPEAQAQILSDLCQRNQSAELTHMADDGPATRARVRFLELRGTELLIDLPTVSGRPLLLEEGETIRLNFLHDGNRLACVTRVRQRTRWSGGGDGVPAQVLDLPTRIEKAQRRECYRLRTVKMPPINVQFNPPEPTDRQPFDAVMLDLSETGCGVVLDGPAAGKVRVKDVFGLAFCLPDQAEPFLITGQVRWVQTLPDGDRSRVGVAWDLDPGAREDRDVQRRLGKYIIEEQRALLRRASEGNAAG